MQNDLLTPLNRISEAAQHLRGETDLTFAQENMLTAIDRVAQEMQTLIVTTPNLTWDRATELLSFEARGHLASIIGYAEMLLDQADGTLDPDQTQYAHQIRADGKALLARLMRLES